MHAVGALDACIRACNGSLFYVYIGALVGTLDVPFDARISALVGTSMHAVGALDACIRACNGSLFYGYIGALVGTLDVPFDARISALIDPIGALVGTAHKPVCTCASR